MEDYVVGYWISCSVLHIIRVIYAYRKFVYIVHIQKRNKKIVCYSKQEKKKIVKHVRKYPNAYPSDCKCTSLL